MWIFYFDILTHVATSYLSMILCETMWNTLNCVIWLQHDTIIIVHDLQQYKKTDVDKKRDELNDVKQKYGLQTPDHKQ